ncbi:hypothetical protein M011DRAFT_455282 [Sporormia fimetaria CBS 119925]|uniref:Uncharacterized protein n=1 Tax=Sporormia fimetaria CBS 119925 TaxID=1340428 RepID=A0A6A6VPP4_9PLEO|nr:hypothetical protein M011DRAFT_455282 [Sporormia fimetaria CBS 119925]
MAPRRPTHRTNIIGDVMVKCLTPEATVYNNIPELITDKNQTTSQAGKPVDYFTGELSHWASFSREVAEWNKSDSIQAAYEACAHVAVERVQPLEEWPQVGGEFTVSGRFAENVLKYAWYAYHFMTGSTLARFGDPHSIPVDLRVTGQLPDWVLIFGDEKDLRHLRMVGEMKTFITVKLDEYIRNAKKMKGDQKPFRGLLGQVVKYMLGHNTKYAFLSNYEYTVFLHLGYPKGSKDHGEPHVYYSDPIRFDQKFDADSQTISVRLAMLYMMFQCLGSDWSVPDTTRKNPERLIVPKGGVYRNHHATPYDKTTEHTHPSLASRDVRPDDLSPDHADELLPLDRRTGISKDPFPTVAIQAALTTLKDDVAVKDLGDDDFDEPSPDDDDGNNLAATKKPSDFLSKKAVPQHESSEDEDSPTRKGPNPVMPLGLPMDEQGSPQQRSANGTMAHPQNSHEKNREHTASTEFGANFPPGLPEGENGRSQQQLVIETTTSPFDSVERTEYPGSPNGHNANLAYDASERQQQEEGQEGKKEEEGSFEPRYMLRSLAHRAKGG